MPYLKTFQNMFKSRSLPPSLQRSYGRHQALVLVRNSQCDDIFQ